MTNLINITAEIVECTEQVWIPAHGSRSPNMPGWRVRLKNDRGTVLATSPFFIAYRDDAARARQIAQRDAWIAERV